MLFLHKCPETDTEGVRKMELIREAFAGMPEVADATLSFTVPDGNSSGSRLYMKQALIQQRQLLRRCWLQMSTMHLLLKSRWLPENF